MSRWGHKYILVIQDLFLAHLEEAYNISSHMHNANRQDPIYIHAYSLESRSCLKSCKSKASETGIYGYIGFVYGVLFPIQEETTLSFQN